MKRLQQLLKNIESSLKLLGFYINTDDADRDEYNEYTLYQYASPSKKKNNNENQEIVTLKIELLHMNFCCGVNELGELRLNIHKMLSNWGAVKQAFIQYAFLHQKMLSMRTSKVKSTVPTTFGLILTTNGVGICIDIEKALSLMPDHFKAVSKTRNPNSRNNITIWVGIF